MYKTIFPLLLFSFFLTGCYKKEHDLLKSENDSLRAQMKINSKAIVTLKEINVLIDSIDAARNVLRLEMIEGIPYPDYTKRMENVLRFVEESQSKISGLQQELSASRNENSAYTMMIDALKNELALAADEIETMQKHVKQVERKNSELVKLARLQQSEINENHLEIESSKQELELFENRIHDLMLQSKTSEADAYYARAEAVAEAANRTKLAPRKKKETLLEAIELYKKSFSLGKAEAEAKIISLEKKL